jgi:hypothetical protein
MLPPPMIRDWASKLIASEADADSTSLETELATVRVYEKLRKQLSEPVGVDAFQALASRALSLTKSRFPGMSALNVTTSGGLRGFGEADAPLSTDGDVEVGTILIAQMLRLVLSLLGEAATVRLIEDAPLWMEVNAETDAKKTSTSATDANYLGPFENISLEADQLRHVSERLEALADAHADVDELIGVAGNIRNVATVLDVFTLVRSKAGGSLTSVLMPPTNGYLN